MSPEINWGFINSGATFESLVSALVLHTEDPLAFPFGKLGPDFAQDVISGDSKTVYQAKFFRDQSASKALSAAKTEAKSIKTYKKSSGKKHWESVENWILVTNSVFNPNWLNKWKEEVVPLFDALNIKAALWERETLESKLRQQPELTRSYFGGENRIFLAPREAFELVDKLNFFPEALKTTFLGRNKEFDELFNFLDDTDKKLMYIHGPGGVGKSRFLLESINKILSHSSNKWQIYWALSEEMSKNTNWSRSIIPEKDTIIIIDEPGDETLIKRLIEQLTLAKSRSASWKILISVRSQKDPIRNLLTDSLYGKVSSEIRLEPLSEEDSLNFCLSLLDISKVSLTNLELSAKRIVSNADYFPIWIAMAVYLLKQNGDLTQLPTSSSELASQYLSEIILKPDELEPKLPLIVLRWISLLGVLNIEDDKELNFLIEKALLRGKTNLQRILSELVEKNFLFQEGSRNRLYKVKPDVIQDYLLINWLTIKFNEKREVTDEGIEILNKVLYVGLESGDIEGINHSIIRTLSRLDYLLESMQEPVHLLRSLISKIESDFRNWGIQNQVNVLYRLTTFSPIYANKVIDICEMAFKIAESEDSSNSVRLYKAMLHTLYENGRYVGGSDDKKRTIELLAQSLISQEKAVGTFTHNNEVVKILSGNPYYRTNFETEFFQFISNCLYGITQNKKISSSDRLILDNFVKAFVDVERRSSYVEPSDVFVIQTFSIWPGTDTWELRKELLKKIFEIINSRSLTEVENITLWEIIHRAVSSLIRKRPSKESHPQIYLELTTEIEWELSQVLSSIKSCSNSPSELRTARKIWSWFQKYEENQKVKNTALECESFFINNSTYSIYEQIIDREDLELARKTAHEKGRALFKTSEHELYSFVEDGIKYLGSDQNISRLFTVARSIGECAVKEDSSKLIGLFDYIKSSIKRAPQSPHFEFAATICNSYIFWKRKFSQDKLIVEIFREFLSYCEKSSQTISLTQFVYGFSWSTGVTEIEAQYVFGLYEHFKAEDKYENFLSLIGGLALSDIKEFKHYADIAINEMPLDRRGAGVNSLLQSLYYLTLNIYEKNGSECIDSSLGQWMLSKIINVPELDRLDDNFSWYLESFLEMVGKPDLKWLLTAILHRLDLYKLGDIDSFNILPLPSFFTSIIQLDDEFLFSDAFRITASILIQSIIDEPVLEDSILELLVEVDPKGIVVPELFLEFLQKNKDSDQLEQVAVLSKIVGYYHKDEKTWRKLAHEFALIINNYSEDEKYSIMYSFLNPRPSPWSSRVGQVAKKFIQDFEEAKKSYDNETDEVLKPFRKWNVILTEERLLREKERVKEAPYGRR